MSPTWNEPECYYTWVHVAINSNRCMYCGNVMDSASTDNRFTKTTARRPKKRSRKKAKGIPNPYNQRPKNYDPHAAW